jgi:hypothetical protein
MAAFEKALGTNPSFIKKRPQQVWGKTTPAGSCFTPEKNQFQTLQAPA